MFGRKPRPAPDANQSIWQRLLVLSGLAFAFSLVSNFVEDRRAKGTKVIWRRFFAVAKPFWFSDGYKSVAGLLSLAVLTTGAYFGLQWAVGQIDGVTRAIIGALSHGYLHFTLY